MSLMRDTLTDLIARISSDFDTRMPGVDSRLRRSFAGVLVRSHAGVADSIYALAEFIARQVMPDTAEAEYLDRWSTIWSVPRKGASAAAGMVTVTGLVGAIVPVGSTLARVDGVQYSTTARLVLTSATGMVPVSASVSGAATTTGAGTSLTFTSPVSGINAAASTVGGLIGGSDAETDTSLLARLLNRIRTPPNGGSAADYVTWALQLPGVTRAWVYPSWMGPGTVGLTFVYDGRPDILPSPAELDAMMSQINALRPVTATPVIFAPTPLPIEILMSTTPVTGAVQSSIAAEITDLFAREAEPGGTIYISRINEAASLAQGEFDHVIHSPAANIVAAPGRLPMLTGVTFA